MAAVSDDHGDSRREDDLIETLRRQASLLELATDAMITEDLDNVVTYWNRGAERIYGWTAEEAVGRNIRELIYADPAQFDGLAEALLRDGEWTGEVTQRAKDGREVIVECHWQAVRDEQGNAVSLFAVNSDITERRRREVEANRAARLESLGTLAGGIAHDLNNVLTPLKLGLPLLRPEVTSAEGQALLDTAEMAVTRGAAMIQQIVAFARGQDGVPEAVCIGEIVEETSMLVGPILPKTIVVEEDVSSHASVVADRTQILQVLVNFLTNARDAMPDGGHLRISAVDAIVDEDASREVLVPPGPYVTVAISDSGHGMPPEVRERVFEPFFTTKPVGAGSGLGLPGSLAIARRHGGTITVTSTPGRGTTFTLYLPSGSAGPEEAADSTAQSLLIDTERGGVVLVADDEESIRRVAASILSAHGFEVLEARDGHEALEIVDRRGQELSVVVTDLAMPGIDGHAVARVIRERHPQVGLVIASAHEGRPMSPEGSPASLRDVSLAKPYSADQLIRAVARARVLVREPS